MPLSKLKILYKLTNQQIKQKKMPQLMRLCELRIAGSMKKISFNNYIK